MAHDFVGPIVVTIVLVVSFGPMSQAISGMETGAFQYGEELGLVLDPMPLLVALGAVIVLGRYIGRVSA